MRLSAHHRAMGDEVELRHVRHPRSIERGLWDRWDRVYASLIFEWSRPLAERLRVVYPDVILGGSGWDESVTVEQYGVFSLVQDYTLYPSFRPSLGFTQRGCRLACSFCKVRRMEGKVKSTSSIWDIWRGESHPRELFLLDNDFFGQEAWPERIAEIHQGGFKVSFNQGFNVRLIGDDEAAAIATMPLYDGRFRNRRVYTAWDNRPDEVRLFRNLEILVKHGVRPDNIEVYMLIGYDHHTKSARPFLTEDDLYRHRRLREFGCRPFPMPYVRTSELRSFQRWTVRRHDCFVPWEEWKANGYRERKQARHDTPLLDGFT